MLVVVVAVPALRGDALGGGLLRHRVPDVEVLELRPHAEVGVRDVDHAARADRAKPRVVGPDLDAVAVQAHDELLALSYPYLVAAGREIALGVLDEAIAHGFDVRPELAVGEELREREA